MFFPEKRNYNMGHSLGDLSIYVQFYITDFIKVNF